MTRIMSTRIGFFARADNGGLGAESWEFCRWMRPEKVLVIRGEHGHHPERFNGMNCQYTDGVPTHAELDRFLRDIDVLFSFETFYNWGAVPMAKSRSIKTVLRVNYEMNINQVDPTVPVPDVFIVPSTWHFDDISHPDKRLLKFPVNREVLPFNRRNRIGRFYHIAGHVAYEDRNGTDTLLAAIPYIQAPVTILSQHQIPNIPSNVTFNFLDSNNYWEVHQGDCLISPRRYGGQSLPIHEALSRGSLVIMPGVKPQNEFLHPDLLYPCHSHRIIEVQGGRVECYDSDPLQLAEKINELYAKDIGYLSDWADQYASTVSWETLIPEYKSLFNSL